MTRSLHRLSARSVTAQKTAGRYADGGGLYLRITDQGARSWVFMITISGKRREIGLGAVTSVSLAGARATAQDMREAAARGQDPRGVITADRPLVVEPVITFGAFADQFITGIEAGWKNPVHRRQWRQSLNDHAANLCDVPIDQVGTDEVLAALQPIWLVKAETASRVRGRIERILDAAKVRHLRAVDSNNPARFRGHLALLLPKQNKLTRGHHAALDWRSGPHFMSELRQRAALSAKALEFTILTAARSGETLGAVWGEVDLAAGLWTLPAGRMKGQVEHVVPLSSAAISVLESVATGLTGPNDVVFAVRGARRSNMAMAQLLKRMNYPDITTHGFRSTFRDWAGDGTDYPRELIEQALAHTIANKAERAYRRGSAVEKRRVLMEDWAEYLNASEPLPN